jgi:hypothetical protein
MSAVIQSGLPPISAKRVARMAQVKDYLFQVGKSTYFQIHLGTGLSVPAVQRAIDDLQARDPDVLAVPAFHNQWSTEVHWGLTARVGEVSQLHHNATRTRRQGHRLRKAAVESTDPMEVLAMTNAATQMEALADNLDALANGLETSRS